MAISANEFKSLGRKQNKKAKSNAPTVKAPQMSKAGKAHLIPWSTSQRRSSVVTS